MVVQELEFFVLDPIFAGASDFAMFVLVIGLYGIIAYLLIRSLMHLS